MINQVNGGKIKKTDMLSKMGNENKELLELVYRMLQFNP